MHNYWNFYFFYWKVLLSYLSYVILFIEWLKITELKSGRWMITLWNYLFFLVSSHILSVIMYCELVINAKYTPSWWFKAPLIHIYFDPLAVQMDLLLKMDCYCCGWCFTSWINSSVGGCMFFFNIPWKQLFITFMATFMRSLLLAGPMFSILYDKSGLHRKCMLNNEAYRRSSFCSFVIHNRIFPLISPGWRGLGGPWGDIAVYYRVKYKMMEKGWCVILKGVRTGKIS